jgi:hypothetical protein
MSGMSSMLCIALYRDGPSHHGPNEEGNGRSGHSRPEKLFPFQSAHRARSHAWHGGMPSMLLMPLMRSTPPFWMPARSVASQG